MVEQRQISSQNIHTMATLGKHETYHKHNITQNGLKTQTFLINIVFLNIIFIQK